MNKIIGNVVIAIIVAVLLGPIVTKYFDGPKEPQKVEKAHKKKVEPPPPAEKKKGKRWFGKQMIGTAISYNYDNFAKITTITTDKDIKVQVKGVMIPSSEEIYLQVLSETEVTYLCVDSISLCKESI